VGQTAAGGGLKMEEIVSFESEGKTVRGILHLPDADATAHVGIVFLQGWAGTRTGPHQMLLKAARRYCVLGIPCLRFDFRGRGDSEGNPFKIDLMDQVADAGAAVRFMRSRVGQERTALVGICSGAEVAIGAALSDPSIDGMALWSAPMVVEADRDAAERRRRRSSAALKEYAKKLLRAQTWRKILRGEVRTDMVRRAVSGMDLPTEQRSARQLAFDWAGQFALFHGGILFIYGSKDPTTPQAIASYKALCSGENIEAEFRIIEGANHGFYSSQWESQVFDTTLAWIEARYGPLPTPGDHPTA
jgi:pimeloyl-ACP methyl ester carboxylesterase